MDFEDSKYRRVAGVWTLINKGHIDDDFRPRRDSVLCTVSVSYTHLTLPTKRIV